MLQPKAFIFVWFFISATWLSAQPEVEGSSGQIRICCYNMENFFDIVDDSLTADDGYTPEGELHWTARRYAAKRNRSWQVLAAVGEWQGLTLVGLEEVESDKVLDDLISVTPLARRHYRYVHEDSPDPRGIDVALIYSPEFSVLEYRVLPVTDPQDTGYRTRDILYVCGQWGEDTLHVFINHWTSRYRGLLSSDRFRQLSAAILADQVAVLLRKNPMAAVIAMGDFNDEAGDPSMQLLTRETGMHCLPLSMNRSGVYGTLKHGNQWNSFDHILVSDALWQDGGRLTVAGKKAMVFCDDMVLATDKVHGGIKPFRTYNGFRYDGGISDHLPVYCDLVRNGGQP